METLVRPFWAYISNAGTHTGRSARENHTIILLNRAWFIITAVQVACLVMHIGAGHLRTAFMTGIYVAGLLAVRVLMGKGKVNAAKITAIAVINANTMAMAYLLGEHTHIIDFLLLTAIMPLYLFETRQVKLTLWGITLGIVPYAIYHYTEPYTRAWALPLAEQMELYESTTWVMVISLSALLFLMYHKNLMYERDNRQKEDELTLQKKMYELILEQIPIDIVTFDRNLCYTYINSTAIKDAEMREWLIGKRNEDYVAKRNLAPHLAEERNRILQDALNKGSKVEIEETFVNRNGGITHSIKGASPVYSEKGNELLSVIGYSLDITAMKEAEQKLREYALELERKNEDLQHFVNATSHDLKTPLRGIASNLQLLERKNKNLLDAESQELIHYSVQSVKKLNQLISDIYQYSVVDRGRNAPDVTNLNEVIDSVMEQMAPIINERKAFVRHSVLPNVKVAGADMGLVFSNLISNALKYNRSATPMVIVECDETPSDFRIKVSDNGIGIMPEYAKQVFDIFKRLHTSAEYEGTGVGLAICKKVVENYGGKIWVEPRSQGGAVFTFSLPKAVVGATVHLPAHTYRLPGMAATG